jgi:hypothetical protein
VSDGPTPPAAVARIGAVVFAVLAVATVGAFFVAQQLKTAPTVIQHPTKSTVFSPRLGDLELGFGIKEDDTLTVEVIDAQGDTVRTLLDDHHQRAYTNVKAPWDGTGDDGKRVPDGVYRVRVLLRDRGRTILLPSSYTVDSTPPRPQVLSVGPRPAGQNLGPAILPRADHAPAAVHFRAPGRRRTILVFRTSGAGAPVRVLQQRVARAQRVWRWDGKVHGHYVAPATYVVVARSQDKAGNVGTSVPLVHGVPHVGYGERYPGHGGITVRHVAVQPPLDPATAGRRTFVGVDARGHSYTWSLRIPGARPAKHGRVTPGQPLRITVPSGFSALYRLGVATDDRAAQSFVPVQSTRKHKVLVVLPATTWQGHNEIDDDGDGRPNTLDDGLSLRLHRVFAGDGLPEGFAGETAPLLRALDAAKLRYDLTTDVALAEGAGPTLAGHSGVVLAGTARWLPDQVASKLRTWVRAGGRLASFGRGALQRYVTVDADGEASRPTQATTTDLFAVTPLAPRPKPTELVSATDTIGLFARTDGQFGPFAGAGRFEDPAGTGASKAVLAAAVDPGGTPVILATRFGRGEVVRFPVPGLPARLASDPELAQVVTNTWTVLSR